MDKITSNILVFVFFITAFHPVSAQLFGPRRGRIIADEYYYRPVSSPAADAPWTRDIIKQENRFFDFKAVAKGTQCEHRFILENPFQETLHIVSATASCTCTSVFIEDDKSSLETYEKTAIVAHLHTDRFNGHKNATINVVIDKPYLATFQLNIHGEIRSDIVVEPMLLRFDNVKDGNPAERSLEVSYTGSRANWKITGFESTNEHITAEISPPSAEERKQVTKIKIKLDEKMPKGKFDERVLLLTNDTSERREIPVMLIGTIGKTVTASPSAVFFGYLKPGEASPVKTVSLRGTAPFRIKKLLCNNPEVQVDFTPNPEAPPRILYTIPLRYTNPENGEAAPKDGKMEAKVQVETDDEGIKLEFKVLMHIAEK
ncbi:hypothetical protein FACS189427_00280 [Planctomycetales bacterium]|nr:hypothetical protein FACS1894214_0560 [Planctomycetales bacterium]GHT33900.1 hypothetical protein FACS189427_00280 [Planctomycetales bacterium]